MIQELPEWQVATIPDQDDPMLSITLAHLIDNAWIHMFADTLYSKAILSLIHVFPF